MHLKSIRDIPKYPRIDNPKYTSCYSNLLLLALARVITTWISLEEIIVFSSTAVLQSDKETLFHVSVRRK